MVFSTQKIRPQQSTTFDQTKSSKYEATNWKKNHREISCSVFCIEIDTSTCLKNYWDPLAHVMSWAFNQQQQNQILY